MSRLFLGIDTSCYTTSLAAAFGENVISLKRPLAVKVGECGLRQSEAFFQHTKNLPELFLELKEKIDFKEYDEVFVTVSSNPRNVENSYMPVFTAGQEVAKIISLVLGAKYFEVSHQEGHIMSAIYSLKKYFVMNEPFLTYHISGGTTELLFTKREGNRFLCEIVGGTKDLPAGQFIDRIGVRSGFSFPSGKEMDQRACLYAGEKSKTKICVNDGYINLSGEETRYERLLESGKDRDFVAYATMKTISDSLKKSIDFAKEKYGVTSVLMVGGVSSSLFIKNEFSDTENVFFAEPHLCTDNAVGVCLMGKMNVGEDF